MRLVNRSDEDVVVSARAEGACCGEHSLTFENLLAWLEQRTRNVKGISRATVIVTKLNRKPESCLAIGMGTVRCSACAKSTFGRFTGAPCIFVVTAKPPLPGDSVAQRRQQEGLSALLASVRSGEFDDDGDKLIIDTDCLLVDGT